MDYPFKGILFSRQKQCDSDMCYREMNLESITLDERSRTKVHTQSESTDVKSWARAKPPAARACRSEGSGGDNRRVRVSFLHDKDITRWTVELDAQICEYNKGPLARML